MAFASMDSGDSSAPLAEINMVPLIDVMLVLLIIFIVTAPLLTHAVKVDLPKAAALADDSPRQRVQLSIDAGSRIYWNSEMLSKEMLGQKLAQAAAQQPQPELHIRAERTTPYEQVAQVMAAAARNGVLRIGFVTDPSR